METVNLVKNGDVSHIILDDAKVNVLNFSALESIKEKLAVCPQDKGAVCISGRPGFFTAGFDLKCFKEGDVQAIRSMIQSGYEFLLALLEFPRPIVMMCSGHAIGMGVFLLCCADYRIGINGPYKVHANEIINGMQIPLILTKIAQNRISKQYLNRVLLNAEPFSLQKGVSLGLIDECVDSKYLIERSLKKAESLSQCQHPFYHQTKQNLLGPLIERCKRELATPIEF